MRLKLICSSVMALSVFMTSFGYAQVIELDLNFRDQGNSIGDEIERVVNLLPGDVDGFVSPIDFLLDDEGDVLTDAEITAGVEPSVILSLLGISSNDTGATTVNNGISGFAINSSPGLVVVMLRLLLIPGLKSNSRFRLTATLKSQKLISAHLAGESDSK